MLVKQPSKSSYRESLKALEADIQHANSLAAALPRDYGGDYIQMRLSYSPFAPLVLFLVEWMDYSCTDTLPCCLGLLHVLVYKVYVDGMPALSSKERKATLREFYAVIYPSLRQLEGEFLELEDKNKRNRCSEVLSIKRAEERRKLSDKDLDRDDECGICMENCTKMVLPSCGHSLCVNCFHDWNLRSQSCPFCRGSLKRVSSKDLWTLISNIDIIDMVTVAKENLRRFYLYIESLPLIIPETHPFMYDYML
ncbi:RING finger protein [Melia azedarach]|uniref:RING finger protein n=2 Tax=Melia azedarach TaxID=155640 RepID=A0ACC1XHV4_MELAZ|nr:RING finger protein [Melia azedarach]KAJ4710935.1 RING finger protein [Melia azedarach]